MTKPNLITRLAAAILPKPKPAQPAPQPEEQPDQDPTVKMYPRRFVSYGD